MRNENSPGCPLAGRVVLITGSTSGIGMGMAEAFAEGGAAVMLHGLGDQDEISALRDRLAATHGVKVAFCDADARDGEAMETLVKATIAQLGGLDILINNAGVQHVSPIEDFAPDRWRAIQACRSCVSGAGGGFYNWPRRMDWWHRHSSRPTLRRNMPKLG